ncbi:substrate-binding domain-containing protein [Paenibacillus vini]|uniref:sugar ABC transporter substrate-binding protein n=1 Tax=Paenibacillus vini TaxID=1476024 RepID=UPI0025B6AA5F|nr:substrate-binding domain-containing protein [Paenibacillus vini]MDN4068205.1 substrate-binding domain-containing protein [Paenibacillus vini]
MKNKRWVFSLVALILTAGLVLSGCGGGKNKEGQDSGKANEGSGKKYSIGVMLYNYTDIQGQQIKSYSSYLENNFNVKFNFATVGSSEEDHISGLENLLASGVDAVISGYDTALEQSVSLAEEAGVYYALALGDADESVTSDYFVGGIKQFGENPEELGAKYAEQAYASGVKHIGVTSFPEFAFVDGPSIIKGFADKMAELDTKGEVTVYPTEFHSFAPDNAADAVTKIISEHPEVDAIFGLGSGMDFVYPAILNSAKPDIRLLALGYNDSTEAGIKDGKVIMAGTNNYGEIMANCFAQLYDRLNGKTYPDAKSNGFVNYVMFATPEELQDFKNYVVPEDKSKGPVTVDELKEVMMSFNESATWESLQKLTNRTLEEIKAARN